MNMELFTNCRFRRHVLIVDDNVDLAESLRILLEFFGCRVDVAHDGVSGLRMALERCPDVIFLDIALPGMTGYQVARAIRAQLSYRAVLLAQTAYGTREDRDKALAAGFDDHLIKPVEPTELMRYVTNSGMGLRDTAANDPHSPI